MTVLCFADTRFPIERANGVQTMATCRALAARGHHVTLVTRPDTAPEPRDPYTFYDEPHASTLHFASVPAAGGPRTRRVRFLLSALARSRRTPGAVIYTRDLGLAALLLQAPMPVRPRIVYEAHGVSAVVAEEMPRLLGQASATASPGKLRRLDRRERRVWRHASAIVTLTQALAVELEQRPGARPHVFVVPDGAKVDSPIAGPAGGQPTTAGYAGHLYPWKGVDVFIRALARVPGLRGLIVGGHPQEADRQRVERVAEASGVAGRLTITGLVPPGEVRRALAPATILVLPNTASAISERYTSPLKLFEYLATGRPIVASDLPAFREILTDGETAVLVRPDDVEALASALQRVASDEALATRLGTAALALAPRYSWDARAARLEAALQTTSLS
ncbi:MAG TPA: glycosyltransferase family 4 protein [Vicinamibacterales bacterium]|nr:glycosyltransferase family 4 protein [Vicinamibacterales bacterium]